MRHFLARLQPILLQRNIFYMCNISSKPRVNCNKKVRFAWEEQGLKCIPIERVGHSSGPIQVLEANSSPYGSISIVEMPALYDHHFGYSLMVGIFGIRYQFSARHFALNWPAAGCVGYPQIYFFLENYGLCVWVSDNSINSFYY